MSHCFWVAQQTLVYQTLTLFYSSWRLHSFPLRSQICYSLLRGQHDRHTSVCLILPVFAISCLCGLPIHIILNLIFLLLICLMSIWSLVQLEGPWRAKAISSSLTRWFPVLWTSGGWVVRGRKTFPSILLDSRASSLANQTDKRQKNKRKNRLYYPLLHGSSKEMGLKETFRIGRYILF